MAAVKITFIGGGSYQWGVALVRDMLVTKGLDGSELVLMDINPAGAEDVRKASMAVQAKTKTRWRITASSDRRASLKNADFVILCISTGALDSMAHDLEIPWKYGIFQTVGDTVGPGGLNRALRNIPVFTGIMEDVNAICPNAWVMNLTNPMTTLTDAVLRSSASGRAVGLCHEISGGRSFISYLLGIKPDEPSFKVCSAGINHCIWMLGASCCGENLIPKIKAAVADKDLAWSGAKRLLKEIDFENFWKCTAVKRELMRMTGVLPLAGDRHTVEFFGHFTNDPKLVADYWGTRFTTITDRREKWLPRMKKKTLDTASGKEKIELRCSHEPVAPIIDAITNGRTYHLEAGNLHNIGQISNLPTGAVVETPCIVSSDGIRPAAMGEMPSAVAAILSGHCHRQQMIVDAAMNADRDLALAALISDPMVRDASTAPQMLSEMMEATVQWLPQFYPKGLKRRTNPAIRQVANTLRTSPKTDTADMPEEIAKR